MADEELDKLFSEHEERKQKERKNEEKRQSEKRVLRNETIELITKTIIPILKKFMKESLDYGHTSEIISNLESTKAYPNVEFKFTLKQEPFDHISPSIISFIHSDTGKIKIEREIITAAGRDKQLPQEVGKVTEQLIETQLKRFIETVLKAN